MKLNILLPTDFSENAQIAADYAFSMFDSSQIKVILVHAVVSPRSTPGMMINLTELMIEDAERDLANEKIRLEEKFGNTGNIEFHAKLGYLQDVVPMFVKAHRIDLIVMGTLGENNLASKILGSNTEHIVRKGFAPLLAVPSDAMADENPRIVIATAKDEIPMGENLEHMFSFLRNQESSRLGVLHVLTSENERAQKALQMGAMQIRVDTEQAETPEEGISQYLDKNEVDMLVVCHRHNTRLDYLFSRSTTKKLTGSIRVPMIIMPG